MNTILLFFALPISTIILSIVLQKLLKCPILVAGTFFAIYLIVTYAVDANLLIFAIAYTIIAFITATLTKVICNLIEKISNCFNNGRLGETKKVCLTDNCICNSEFSYDNNLANENNNRARITLSTNQENPVVFLTNRNNNCKNHCRFCKR